MWLTSVYIENVPQKIHHIRKEKIKNILKIDAVLTIYARKSHAHIKYDTSSKNMEHKISGNL